MSNKSIQELAEHIRNLIDQSKTEVILLDPTQALRNRLLGERIVTLYRPNRKGGHATGFVVTRKK